MRTDKNNNPTAFTIDLAQQAGLKLGEDYEVGDLFVVPGIQHDFYTAKLLGDPIALTINVIDAVGFYTQHGAQRWAYIAIPQFVWVMCQPETKKKIIGFMYEHEGGTEMKGLFA